MEQQKYQIFDGEDTTYELVVTSNANIRKVCKVLTECRPLSDEDRIHYARHGHIKPNKTENDEATYNFAQKYDDVTVWAALAEVLFYSGPSLLAEDEDGTISIPESTQPKFEKLIRSEVMRARDDFLAKFGVNPPEVKNLFQQLGNARIPMTIAALQKVAQKYQQQAPSTNETSPTGGEASSPTSDTGKK